MVRPDIEKWGQTLDDLLDLATNAEHKRTCERFLALYMIGSERTNATLWALEIKRDDNTVLRWVHQYNQLGPTALTYRRTGGRPPFLRRRRSAPSLRP